MAASIARVGSVALTELKTDLTRLSKTLYRIYDLMNADMRQVNAAWQDNKYKEFVEGYKPQIEKCREISERYSEWCTKVLDPTIENVIAVERTDVGGSSGSIGGMNSADALGGGMAAAGAVGVAGGFNMGANQGPKPTTKAVPISNGCGSETDPKSFAFAAAGRVADTKLGTIRHPWNSVVDEWKAQGESCDIHDKCYYKGEGKEKCDIEFQQRSPIMGSAVRLAKETSGKSYEEAQKDRQLSEQLQATWEEEHQQSLDAENYRVIPND